MRASPTAAAPLRQVCSAKCPSLDTLPELPQLVVRPPAGQSIPLHPRALVCTHRTSRT